MEISFNRGIAQVIRQEIDLVPMTSTEVSDDSLFRLPLGVSTPTRSTLTVQGGTLKNSAKLKLTFQDFAANRRMIAVGDVVKGQFIPSGTTVKAYDAFNEALILSQEATDEGFGPIEISGDRPQSILLELVVRTSVSDGFLRMTCALNHYYGNGEIEKTTPIPEHMISLEGFLKQCRTPPPSLDDIKSKLEQMELEAMIAEEEAANALQAKADDNDAPPGAEGTEGTEEVKDTEGSEGKSGAKSKKK